MQDLSSFPHTKHHYLQDQKRIGVSGRPPPISIHLEDRSWDAPCRRNAIPWHVDVASGPCGPTPGGLRLGSQYDHAGNRAANKDCCSRAALSGHCDRAIADLRGYMDGLSTKLA